MNKFFSQYLVQVKSTRIHHADNEVNFSDVTQSTNWPIKERLEWKMFLVLNHKMKLNVIN